MGILTVVVQRLDHTLLLTNMNHLNKSVVFLLFALVAYVSSLPGPQLQVEQPTSDADQFKTCLQHEQHGAYSHPRLVMTWKGSEPPNRPLQYLRRVLADDLNLAHLAFTLKRVKLLPNKLSFEMSSKLTAYEVLREYCKLFNRITMYRSQGYDDQPLSYEILLGD